MISLQRAARLFLIPFLVMGLLLPSASPAAAADAPGRCSTGAPTSPNNTWISEALTSSTDVDWFKFSLGTTRQVLVTLGRLPADYRLDLYGPCGTLLKSSNRSAKTYEEISIRLAAGIYHVKVSGVGGAYHPDSYRLKFRPLASGVIVLSHRGLAVGLSSLEIVGEVVNNTAEKQRWVRLEATYHDSSGQVVGTSSAWTGMEILKPQARSPFKFYVAAPPPGYHHYKLKVAHSETTTDSPLGKLVITKGVPYTDIGGVRHYPGTLRNDNTFTVEHPTVTVTLYGRLGQVLNTEWASTDATSLAPAATSGFDVYYWENYSGVNRSVWVPQAVGPRAP
jgi:hypothetical protein